MGVKNLLPHVSALEGPSSLSPSKKVIVVTQFTDNQHSVCAHTLYAATVVTYKLVT